MKLALEIELPMYRALLILVGLTPSMLLAGETSLTSWSPDGRWLAYRTVARADRPLPRPGWIFETSQRGQQPSPARDEGDKTACELVYRIYATSIFGEGTTLLEESRKPLTAPSWSPDGRSLAFSRIVTEGPGAPRFELVLQDGLRRQRVSASRPMSDNELAGGVFTSEPPVWSPDGRCIAVCGFPSNSGLTVIRADNGRALKTIERGSLPSWSPDSSKLAFLERRGQVSTLYVLEESFGAVRKLAVLGPTYQSVWWPRDGKSLLVADLRQSTSVRSRMPIQFAAIDKIEVANGHSELYYQLTNEMDSRLRDIRGISVALDPDCEELYFTISAEGKSNEVLWHRPKVHEPRGRSHPIDASIRIDLLALSPTGMPLAVGLGPPGPSAPIATWSYEERDPTPIVPDDSARVEWLTLLIGSAHQLLEKATPLTAGTRASILPPRTSLAANREPYVGLRKIGRIGRPLCDRPADAPPADAALIAFLNEAKLFFDYLYGDDRAAFQDLEAFEEASLTADQRMRLLCLRGQILAGLGELDRAKDVVEFVKASAKRGRSRLEITPEGPILTVEPSPVDGWALELAQSVDLIEKLRLKPGSRDDSAADHLNPDAPPPPGTLIPGMRLDDPDVFAPVVPRDRFGRGVPGGEDILPGRPEPPVMPRFPRNNPPF